MEANKSTFIRHFISRNDNIFTLISYMTEVVEDMKNVLLINK